MIVSSKILQLPNLKTEEEQKMTALVMQYFEPSLECYADEVSEELIKNVCICIEHVLCIHKGYKLLDTLTTFINNSPSNLRLIFSKFLSGLLLDLFNKESDTNSSNAKELQKTLRVLNIESVKKDNSVSPFIPPVGRSARIARMAKNSPKSPRKRGKNVEALPTALRLFGKDLDTLSPLHVKGSQLNNATPKSKKIISTLKTVSRSSPSINDEKSTDFVPIDTEVKFQPEKLSKHQKEVLRKRREDIPALYQDLSQSLSQDIFSSSSSSKDFDKTDQLGPSDKRKVIVEVIGDEFKADAFPIEEKCEVPFHAPPETALKEPVQSIGNVNVPNLLSDPALSSEIIPEAPVQTIEDLIPITDLSFEANLFPDAMLPSEIISEEATQIINELTVPSNEVNTEENIISQKVGSDKVLRAEETMIQEGNAIVSGSSAGEGKSKSVDVECKEKLTNQKLEVSIERQPYQIEVVVEGPAKSEVHEKERRRKQKIELELQKLRMDIVGAEEFLAASRRTRTREKPKKLDDSLTKKLKATVKEEKSSPQRPQRKSLNMEISELKESITEKNRRKTVSGVQGAKNVDDISIVSSTHDKFNKPKDPDVTETRLRRSWKYKLDDNKVKPNVTSPIQENVNTPMNKIFGKYDTTEAKEAEQGQKRKRNSGDEESEDIIESSQEFPVVLTPVYNTSKRKSSIDTSCTPQKFDKSEEKTLIQQKTITKEDFSSGMEHNLNEFIGENNVEHIEEKNKPIESKVLDSVIQEVGETSLDDVCTKQTKNESSETEEVHAETNTSQDTTVTQDSTQDESQGDYADVEHPVTQDTQTQTTQTQDTLTLSEVSTVSEHIHPPVLYFDLPKKPELTESERIMCRMDTMSICMDPKNLPLKIHSDDHFVEEFEVGSGLPKDAKSSMDMEDVLGKRCLFCI